MAGGWCWKESQKVGSARSAVRSGLDELL